MLVLHLFDLLVLFNDMLQGKTPALCTLHQRMGFCHAAMELFAMSPVKKALSLSSFLPNLIFAKEDSGDFIHLFPGSKENLHGQIAK